MGKILGNSNINLLKYEWIWEKNKATGFLNSKKMPLKSHENILVFYKKLPLYKPQGLIKKDKPTINKGDRGKRNKVLVELIMVKLRKTLYKNMRIIQKTF
jgi:site-specific DNA-methyltransferase (adenine-specific)